MGKEHTVTQGEHLVRIASEYGFADSSRIWEHGDNAELRSRRDPHVLFPGDVVALPEKEEGEATGETGQRHRFKVARNQLFLRLRLLDLDEQPCAGVPCTLRIGLVEYRLETDANGIIEQAIEPRDEQAVLACAEPGPSCEIPIAIGHLDPVEELSGCAGRLRNLGYYVGGIPDYDEMALQSAVEEFQCDHGLTVDGIPGPKTQAKLEAVHGC